MSLLPAQNPSGTTGTFAGHSGPHVDAPNRSLRLLNTQTRMSSSEEAVGLAVDYPRVYEFQAVLLQWEGLQRVVLYHNDLLRDRTAKS